MTDVAVFLSSHLMNVCDCYYTSDFIANGQFLCYSSDRLVYQGHLLAADGISAEEIRNLTQIWVLGTPVVKLASTNLQVDSSCSVILTGVGDPYCDSDDSVTFTSKKEGTFPVSAGVGVISTTVVLVVVFIILVVVVTCWFGYCRHRYPFQHSKFTSRYV